MRGNALTLEKVANGWVVILPDTEVFGEYEAMGKAMVGGLKEDELLEHLKQTVEKDHTFKFPPNHSVFIFKKFESAIKFLQALDITGNPDDFRE